jgi:HD-like signal output (HDOD) protein
VILGFNTVFQIVLQEGVKSTMPQTEEFEKLQERSYLTSLISHEISNLSTREKSGINSTIAILSNIGQSVVLLLKKKNPKISELLNGLDHAKLGAALLGSWELPENLCKVVQYQDYPEFSPPTKLPDEIIDEISVLYMSRVCYDRLMDDGEEKEADSSSFFTDYASVLKFPKLSPDDFLKEKIVPAMLKMENRLPQALKYRLQQSQFNVS